MSEDAEITEIPCEECGGRGSFRPPRGCPAAAMTKIARHVKGPEL